MQQHQAIPGRERVGLPPAGAAQQQVRMAASALPLAALPQPHLHPC